VAGIIESALLTEKMNLAAAGFAPLPVRLCALESRRLIR
jgi:hypothetical protein